MTTLPSQHYIALVNKNNIRYDANQYQALQYLDTLHISLKRHRSLPKRAFYSPAKLFSNRFLSSTPKGSYLWGNVGSGKSFITDIFYNSLPFTDKLRIHFHRFMQCVHQDLKQYQGHSNPLQQVAINFAKRARIICFDELLVNDITDAMILARLFDALYEQRVCLSFTSNISPQRLYEKGLQRQRFIPAIELIKKHCKIINLVSDTDYRRTGQQAIKHYFYPLTQITHDRVLGLYQQITQDNPLTAGSIQLHDRPINYIACHHETIWFDFMAICSIPRSQNDYLSIATTFHTVFVTNMPVLKPSETHLARSFINLIDVLYDHKVRLIISAEAPIDQLYPQGRLITPFTRTRSRLVEMQSPGWAE